MLNIYKTIIYLGIIAFILFFITFLLGITHSPFILHYYFAILSLLFVCFHLGLIIYPKFKRKKKK